MSLLQTIAGSHAPAETILLSAPRQPSWKSRKTKLLSLWLNQDELILVDQAAHLSGLSRSDYVRRVIQSIIHQPTA